MQCQPGYIAVQESSRAARMLFGIHMPVALLQRQTDHRYVCVNVVYAFIRRTYAFCLFSDVETK